jgi:hypothetical protein
MTDYPGRDPFKDPIHPGEFQALMSNPRLWPPRAFGVDAERGCALRNAKTGASGLLVNVPWRDRLTVYETNVFDGEVVGRIYNTEGPTGVPEHKYEDFEAMVNAGWRPD